MVLVIGALQVVLIVYSTHVPDDLKEVGRKWIRTAVETLHNLLASPSTSRIIPRQEPYVSHSLTVFVNGDSPSEVKRCSSSHAHHERDDPFSWRESCVNRGAADAMTTAIQCILFTFRKKRKKKSYVRKMGICTKVGRPSLFLMIIFSDQRTII